MTERARRTLGLVASLLLAVPALMLTVTASHADTAAPLATRKVQPINEPRKATSSHRRRQARHVFHPVSQAHAAIRHAVFADSSPPRLSSPLFGLASWYGGRRWHGNITSSGAVYDENALTAAHATLPMGSRVRVSLVGQDRSVVVTINDRPGTRRRVIDLSRGAARELGILDRGIALVSLTPLPAR
jgi:rare lipoprotein A (peptidoglycan hydrolase)